MPASLQFVGAGIQEDIRNLSLCGFDTVFAQFGDPNGNLVNVANPRLTMRSARYDPADPDGLVVSGAALFNFTTGTYGYTLSPEVLEPGYYSLAFSGTITSGQAPASGYSNVSLPVGVCVEGQIQILERTIEMDLTLRVRRRLKDLNTRLYRLDLPVQKWPDDEIIDALLKALGEINATPPMRTNFSFHTLPVGVVSFVQDLAYADLLESQSILENANTFTMNDGSANLSLQRAQLYASQANAIHQRADNKLYRWKKSLVPNVFGQGTNQYPFQIRHVISFLPNFKNIFGG